MEKYEWEPLYSRILVKRKIEEKTAGGLYIPETTREMRPTEGEVVLVGKECSEIKVGDYILYGKHSYLEKEIDGEMYDMMNENDVLVRRITVQTNA